MRLFFFNDLISSKFLHTRAACTLESSFSWRKEMSVLGEGGLRQWIWSLFNIFVAVSLNGIYKLRPSSLVPMQLVNSVAMCTNQLFAWADLLVKLEVIHWSSLDINFSWPFPPSPNKRHRQMKQDVSKYSGQHTSLQRLFWVSTRTPSLGEWLSYKGWWEKETSSGVSHQSSQCSDELKALWHFSLSFLFIWFFS